MAAPDEINITDVGAGDWIRQLCFSFPGWGKTSYEGQAPEDGHPTLLIRSSLDLMPARILKSGAKMYTADTWESMDRILDYCRMTPDPFPYEWVWWDNISTAQDKLLDDIWDATVIAYPRRAVKTIAGGKDRGEYWRNAERIQEWVRHMVGVNRFHFGIGAHPTEGQHPTNDEGGFVLKPYVQVKNMTEKICGYMNQVCFLEVAEDDDDADKRIRTLHFRENARFYAKDQYDAFLPSGKLVDPSIDKVMRAVAAARTGTATTRRGTAAGRRGRRAA